jgi:hypothetical protein
MAQKVNIITKKEWEILRYRQSRSRVQWDFKVIEMQTEEMIETKGEPFSLNNYAANAAPSEQHAINENKDKDKVVVKDVDTGIGNGKFRIMITYE